MAQSLLSRVVLSVLAAAGAIMTFFESIYLRDQAVEFKMARIARWMWLFRIVTVLLLGLIVFLIAR